MVNLAWLTHNSTPEDIDSKRHVKCFNVGLLLYWRKRFALLFHSKAIAEIKEDNKNNQQRLLNPTGQFKGINEE